MNNNEEREHTDYTPCWCNQWIPPTDEERVMFANSKTKPEDFEHSGGYESFKFRQKSGKSLMSAIIYKQCKSTCVNCEESWKEIAESLALDGMDNDDVSKIEELMR